nr:MAG TPA: hypothetical protein [Caudoviricetes sp.]
MPAGATIIWNLKDAYPPGVCRTRGNLAALVRGWGLRISHALSEVSGRGQPCAKSPNQTRY